jgi:hypothetical protein
MTRRNYCLVLSCWYSIGLVHNVFSDTHTRLAICQVQTVKLISAR